MFTIQNLICILLIFILLHAIKCDWEYDNDQNSLTSRPLYEYNFGRTETETEIIEYTTVDDEMFDDNQLKKLFVINFKKFESMAKETSTEVPQQIKNRPRRTLREKDDLFNDTRGPDLACYKCFGNTTSKHSTNCYEGFSLPLTKCADIEQCYIEVNPTYIKRGCILPGRVNKTFVCKCPLCNDKPSFEPIHYEYKDINDWEYDNVRLQKPLENKLDLMCKVCETKGTNPVSDKNCRVGKNADYMVCARNQLCFTNVDDETDFVSRGCISKPAFNSIFFFCNNTACNHERFFNPKDKKKIRRRAEISYKEEKMSKKKNLGYKISSMLSVILLSGVLVLLMPN